MASSLNLNNNSDLSAVICKALGWRFEYAYVIGDVDGNSTRYYKVYDPSGKLITPNDYDDEWAEYMMRDAHPDYEHDANAALTLTVEGYYLELTQREAPERGKWFAQYFNDNTINAFTGWADSPAEAICLAYLALVDVKAKG